MESSSYLSYVTATVAYFLLIPLALAGVKKNPFSIPFVVAVICSLSWSGYIVYRLHHNNFFTPDSLPFETLRDLGWFFFLGFVISKQQSSDKILSFFKSRLSYLILIFTACIFTLEMNSDYLLLVNQYLDTDLRLFAHVVFAVIGLMLVEQIYRNAFIDQRWVTKFLCLGLGGIFIVDFILYSKSLLFSTLDFTLWNSRGFINALVVPMLIVSLLRLQEKHTTLTVSRKLVFHTTVLFGSGLYLILMSIAG